MTPIHRFVEIIDDLKHTLSFLKDLGYNGVECSEHMVKLVHQFPIISVGSTNDSLQSIFEEIKNCQRCKLYKSRKTIVFGSGNPNARLVFVGEAPGYEEDEQGLPFVGPAGQLLTKIIHAIQLTREDVYICNVVKCHPPANRKPDAEEISMCLPFLERQLDVIRPQFICALGTVAAQSLLRSTAPISELRGRFYDFKGAKLMPTFHPSYLLRYPAKKREVWEDMKQLMKQYS